MAIWLFHNKNKPAASVLRHFQEENESRNAQGRAFHRNIHKSVRTLGIVCPRLSHRTYQKTNSRQSKQLKQPDVVTHICNLASLGYKVNHRPMLTTKKDSMSKQKKKQGMGNRDEYLTLSYFRINTKWYFKREKRTCNLCSFDNADIIQLL